MLFECKLKRPAIEERFNLLHDGKKKLLCVVQLGREWLDGTYDKTKQNRWQQVFCELDGPPGIIGQSKLWALHQNLPIPWGRSQCSFKLPRHLSASEPIKLGRDPEAEYLSPVPIMAWQPVSDLCETLLPNSHFHTVESLSLTHPGIIIREVDQRHAARAHATSKKISRSKRSKNPSTTGNLKLQTSGLWVADSDGRLSVTWSKGVQVYPT